MGAKLRVQTRSELSLLEEIPVLKSERLTLDALREADRAAFAAGIVLADGTACLPAKLEPLGEGLEALVTLHEGKFHQIKRMIASRGAAVCRLERLSMGTLVLDETLERGQYRLLTGEEVLKIGGKHEKKRETNKPAKMN